MPMGIYQTFRIGGRGVLRRVRRGLCFSVLPIDFSRQKCYAYNALKGGAMP